MTRQEIINATPDLNRKYKVRFKDKNGWTESGILSGTYSHGLINQKGGDKCWLKVNHYLDYIELHDVISIEALDARWSKKIWIDQKMETK